MLSLYMEDVMANRFIMTAFGKDRPGIVDDVTKILYENVCNLEDNTICLLYTSPSPRDHG